MKKIILMILVIAFSFSSCEKDDICDGLTPTTPKLIIEFYDSLNPANLKNVSNLKITGEGMTDFLLFNGVSKIHVPLKTTQDLTKFSFLINSTDIATDNEDFLQFNYSRQNLYVSRACGYKTLFTLDTTTPYILSDAATPDGLWIKSITIATSNIETENETHVKIYF